MTFKIIRENINFVITEFLKPKMIIKYEKIAPIFTLTDNILRECIYF